MINRTFFSRRKFLRLCWSGLGGLIMILFNPFQQKSYGNDSNSDKFDTAIYSMPQYALSSPESVKGNFGVFRVPVSALHKVGPLDEGFVVKLCFDKGRLRLRTVFIEILAIDENQVLITEKPIGKQPASNLKTDSIILDDLRDSLKRLNEINHKEVQSRFYVIGGK